MITLQGAGAIVVRADGAVLLVRVKRRGMQRWELPTAIRKKGESLLITVYRCVEEESGFQLKCRIGRSVCLGLNASKQLSYSYFAMFFECTAESIAAQSRDVPDIHADLPPTAKQNTIESQFIDWRRLKPHELHPQHRVILEQWANPHGGGMFAVISDADQEVNFYRSGLPSTPNILIGTNSAQRPPESSIELNWIHVSDVHFGNTPKGLQSRKRLILENLVEDVERNFSENPSNFIFVTGDIAYRAEDDEYQESLSWLGRLAEAAKITLDRVWLIPGNHDIRRAVIDIDPKLKRLHADVRKNPMKLDEAVVDPMNRELLESKLEPYSTWVRQNFKHITSPLDWSTLFTTPNSRKVLITGLCTVWVSDGDDGKPNRAGTWSNNMFVSQDRSLSALKLSHKEPDLTILLTHHPMSWLCLRSTRWLDNVLGTRAVVHLCGHVHEESGGVLFSMGTNGRRATIIAGAVHESDDWQHGYSWGQLRFEMNARRWHLGWAPRTWVRGSFTADRTNYSALDADGYCWEPMEQ